MIMTVGSDLDFDYQNNSYFDRAGNFPVLTKETSMQDQRYKKLLEAFEELREHAEKLARSSSMHTKSRASMALFELFDNRRLEWRDLGLKT